MQSSGTLSGASGDSACKLCVTTDAPETSNNSTVPHKKDGAFNRDEAVRLIIAGMQSGAITLPFAKAFDASLTDKMIQQAQSGINRQWTAEFVRSAEGRVIASEFANLARKDALYLLTLLHTLVIGISEEEAQRITNIALSR